MGTYYQPHTAAERTLFKRVYNDDLAFFERFPECHERIRPYIPGEAGPYAGDVPEGSMTRVLMYRGEMVRKILLDGAR